MGRRDHGRCRAGSTSAGDTLSPTSLVQSCRLVHMIAVVVLFDSSLLVVEAGRALRHRLGRNPAPSPQENERRKRVMIVRVEWNATMYTGETCQILYLVRDDRGNITETVGYGMYPSTCTTTHTAHCVYVSTCMRAWCRGGGRMCVQQSNASGGGREKKRATKQSRRD